MTSRRRGEFANQLDLDSYEYTTLAQMLARDVGTPKTKEYVSPDGSLVLPAVRVFQQGPDDSYAGMDATGWRWSNTLTANGLLSAKPGQKILPRDYLPCCWRRLSVITRSRLGMSSSSVPRSSIAP